MRLVGVGVGPGDPELVTVKGVRVLREADLVLVPVMAPDEQGRAEAVGARARRVGRARRLRPQRPRRRDRAARERLGRRGAPRRRAPSPDGADTVAFATIGDPNVYSTFTYLAQAVRGRAPDVVGRDRPRHHRDAGPGRPLRHRALPRAPSRSPCCRSPAGRRGLRDALETATRSSPTRAAADRRRGAGRRRRRRPAGRRGVRRARSACPARTSGAPPRSRARSRTCRRDRPRRAVRAWAENCTRGGGRDGPSRFRRGRPGSRGPADVARRARRSPRPTSSSGRPAWCTRTSCSTPGPDAEIVDSARAARWRACCRYYERAAAEGLTRRADPLRRPGAVGRHAGAARPLPRARPRDRDRSRRVGASPRSPRRSCSAS